jgi:glycosyltransferase involved in cell wall biosynthesis
MKDQSMPLTAIILTYNEKGHLRRCVESIADVADQIVVVDSYSTDGTAELAMKLGASVIQNRWVNYSTQFNWALSQLDEGTDWVLRLDADEYFTPELVKSVSRTLPGIGRDFAGIYVGRRMAFQGRLIRHGGIFPVQVLRIFKRDFGRCENRWMDEHIIVEGKTTALEGEIIDDNLNSLSWWTEKHNAYASREVVDLLNLEFGFIPYETVASLRGGQQTGVKRWLKENVYVRLPRGSRAFAYFFYRFVLRLGFLDGREGAAFHVLQGFWYRYLVDMKFYEVRKYMLQKNVDAPTAIRDVLGIDVLS